MSCHPMVKPVKISTSAPVTLVLGEHAPILRAECNASVLQGFLLDQMEELAQTMSRVYAMPCLQTVSASILPLKWFPRALVVAAL